MGRIEPGAVHAVWFARRPPVPAGGRLRRLPAARRSGVSPPAHTSCRKRHRPIAPVGCAHATRVFQGVRGGAWVQLVGNRPFATGWPRAGCR